MKQYKALLFDFDDTLFDFKKSETIALSGTFERYDVEKSENTFALYEAENQAFWRGFEKGIYKTEGDSAVRFAHLCRALGREDIDWREMNEVYLDLLCSTAFPIENSPALLEKLSQKYALYIVTNSLKKVNEARSVIGGIEPFLSGKFISESIGVSKPQKGFFDYCFAHIAALPEETLLIGDSLISDMKGAAQYGIDCCWFNPRHKENTAGIAVTYEIRSLWELEKILQIS